MSDRRQEKALFLPEVDDQKANRRSVSPSQSSEHLESPHSTIVKDVFGALFERMRPFLKESLERQQETQQ